MGRQMRLGVASVNSRRAPTISWMPVSRAATWARDNGVQVIAFTGFDGGRTAGLATAHLHVEGDNYGIIEDAHQSLMHVLAQYLRQSRMKEDRIAQRKF